MRIIYALALLLTLPTPLQAAPPAPDADMKRVMDAIAEKNVKPFSEMSVEEARKQPYFTDVVKEILEKDGRSPELAPLLVRQRKIPGPAGELPVVIFRPWGEGPFPVVVWYHGGGWVVGRAVVEDPAPRQVANLARAIVVSVDYRLAPEAKFPAAAEDSFAAYKWVRQHAAEIGGDPARVAVAGESAGGNLAADVALLAREKNFVQPTHQLLIYPVAGTDFETPSYKEFENQPGLGKKEMAWFFGHYTKAPIDLKDPLLDLVNADLNALAPATVITAEIDPLRSEGNLLAQNLDRAGVKVSYQNYTGVVHGFFGLYQLVAKAKEAQAFAAEELKKAFAR